MGEALGLGARQCCWSYLIFLLMLIAGPTSSSCSRPRAMQENIVSHSTAFFSDGEVEGPKATL